jgi:nucleotide-binding universal stress UspA family protein
MKPIVLATDGSPSAAEATLQAIELARAFDTPLVAIAVEHARVPSYGYYGYADLVMELGKLEREHVTKTLEQVEAIATEHGIECEALHATGGVVEAIVRAARERNARMLVIGAHGWGALGRVLHGSVSSAVAQEAQCPVLIVRAGDGVDLHDIQVSTAMAAK